MLIPAYRKNKEYETKKRIIKNEEEIKVTKAVRYLEEENTKIAKVISERAEEEKVLSSIDPTFKWEKDFNSFKNSSVYYSFRGLVNDFYRGEQATKNSTLISFLDSLDVVQLAPGNPGYVSGFTDKGKFFIRRMMETS